MISGRSLGTTAWVEGSMVCARILSIRGGQTQTRDGYIHPESEGREGKHGGDKRGKLITVCGRPVGLIQSPVYINAPML